MTKCPLCGQQVPTMGSAEHAATCGLSAADQASLGMPTVHYHWGQNVPGYLPMSDEANYAATFEAARDCLLEDMAHVSDQYAMGGLDDNGHNDAMADAMELAIFDVTHWDEPDTTYAASDRPHDLGMAFWVVACDEDSCRDDDEEMGR